MYLTEQEKISRTLQLMEVAKSSDDVREQITEIESLAARAQDEKTRGFLQKTLSLARSFELREPSERMQIGILKDQFRSLTGEAKNLLRELDTFADSDSE